MKQATLDRYNDYVIANYTRYPVCLVRGEGSRVWDDEGKRYLDFFPGWGCDLLGHCPPRVVEAVREQVGELIHVPNTWYTEPQGLLAEALSVAHRLRAGSASSATAAPRPTRRPSSWPGSTASRAATRSSPCSTASTAGRWAPSAPPASRSITRASSRCCPASATPPSATSTRRRRLIDAETCAILVEPIQGEGGVNLPPAGYLEGLRELADQHKLLLIFDEVQTGMGRTGRWYAHQHWNVTPDVVTLAKALAGGVACGGLVARPEVAEKLRPGTHAATFGGNPLACARRPGDHRDHRGGRPAGPRRRQIGERFRGVFEALRPRCPLDHGGARRWAA